MQGLAIVAIVHAPVLALQHAAGCGQGLGEQTPPAWKVFPASQPGCAVEAQKPESGSQHAPGCGQGVGEQTVFAPWNVRPAPHEACVNSAQLPKVLEQHAPAGGQDCAPQVVPAPLNEWPPELHPGWATKVHPPLMVLQHAPGWAQVLGAQTPPAV